MGREERREGGGEEGRDEDEMTKQQTGDTNPHNS